MPDKLDEYFRGRYRQEKQELKRLDQLVARVFPTFRDCRLGGSWPYELAEGKPIEIGESYSFSTNSMVLYAICSAHGYLGYDTFGPDESRIPVRHPIVLTAAQLQEAVTAVINGCREASDLLQLPNVEEVVEVDEDLPPADQEAGADAQEITFRSSSFGQDDPLTLSWFISVVVALKKHAPSLVDPILNGDGAMPFWPRLVRSAATTIRRLFDDDKLLLFSDGDGNDPVDHAFIRLKTVHLAEVLRSSLPQLMSIVGVENDELINNANEAIQYYNARLSTLRQFFLDRLYQHLAHDSVRDGPFDAAELVFSLEGTLLCHPNRAFFDSDLIDRVFEVIDRRQKNNPYWRPLKPFLITPQGFALLPLSVEIANSLLRICDLIHDDERPVSYFSQHLGLFGRYTEWLQTRSSQGKTEDGREFFGWHSEHTFQPGQINPWETSQVALFLMHYRSKLQQHIAHQASDAANFDATPKQSRPTDEHGIKQSAMAYWHECINKFEPIRGQDAKPKVYRDVGDLFVAPRTQPNSTTRPRVSMLLYGPPGTGKSSLAEELANALEWPLITITPSDFVTNGESEVEARAKLIFTALGEQSHCVVLFDEIDRLILDRDSPWYYSQSDMFQFMTPGMLPKLKALWKSKRLVFVIATNYEERIDPAAIRAGRVDERILVSPSDLTARKLIIEQRIQKECTDAGLEAPALDDDQLAAIGRCCPLASYGEMEACVREMVESIDLEDMPNVQMFSDLLSDRLRRQHFSLGMQAYRNRFNATRKVADNDQELAREPIDEFLVLIRTWLEANLDFRPQDKLLVTRVLAAIAKSNAINPELIDNANGPEARRDALANALTIENGMTDVFSSLPSIRAGINSWYDDNAIENGVH